MSKLNRIFVYGTLRDRLPTIQTNDQIAATAIDLGSYPAIISLGGPSLIGDVVEVDNATLDYLDRYEGVDRGLYKRVTTTTEAGHEVMVYVWAKVLAEWDYAKPRYHDNGDLQEGSHTKP